MQQRDLHQRRWPQTVQGRSDVMPLPQRQVLHVREQAQSSCCSPPLQVVGLRSGRALELLVTRAVAAREMDAVDDDTGRMEAFLLKTLEEETSFPERRGLGRGNDDEARIGH